MDAPEVTPEDFAACLADIAKVNTVTLARPPTLAWLARATRPLRRGDSFSLLDVGYGQGDMLRAIHRWARARGLRPQLMGVDLNPRSAPAARAATPPEMAIDYRTGDVFAHASPPAVDFVVSSLVTHHMSDAQVVRFLGWMDGVSRRGWFVNDLHRHALAFHGFRLLSAAAGWHPFVRHDGPVSVARAFRKADWIRLIGAAGIAPQDVTIAGRFPFRLCVGRVR